MQVQIDGKTIFEITEIDRLLLADDLINVDAEIARRLEWVIKHKVDEVFKRFKATWDVYFERNPSIAYIPTGKDEYVRLVTLQKDYRNCEFKHTKALEDEKKRRASLKAVKGTE